MNVLVTTSRMPFSIEAIRCFGRAGHRVFATVIVTAITIAIGSYTLTVDYAGQGPR